MNKKHLKHLLIAAAVAAGAGWPLTVSVAPAVAATHEKSNSDDNDLPDVRSKNAGLGRCQQRRRIKDNDPIRIAG